MPPRCTTIDGNDVCAGAVFHVTARAVATHALSIFGDHGIANGDDMAQGGSGAGGS